MKLSEENNSRLQHFFNISNFAEEGGVITDLDGTAVHEYEGRLAIPETVGTGLKKIYDLGRPIVINTLRFPFSVMRTFGKEWYGISNAPVPTVLLNGSLLGYMVQNEDGDLGYEEIMAFPLEPAELDNILGTVEELVADSINDLLVFYYPRDWRQGEIIWTPQEENIPEVRRKYLSAASVVSSSTQELRDGLKKQDICMVFLLIDIPQDKLMAYQHTKKSNFFTHAGVDKLFGARQIASALNIKLEHCLGAGDSEMDTFLKGVGQAVHVGNPYLTFESILPPIRLGGSMELGELLSRIADMQRTVIN